MVLGFLTDLITNVLNAAISLGTSIAGAMSGMVKAILEYQHSNPVGFMLIFSGICLLLIGVAATQGTTITGLVIGEYKTTYELGVIDNVTGPQNFSDYSLVMAYNRKYPYFAKSEDVVGDNVDTWLHIRFYNSPCPAAIKNLAGNDPVVWEESFVSSGWLDPLMEWIYQTKPTRYDYACAGFMNASSTVTFSNETDALLTIRKYYTDGALCPDWVQLPHATSGIDLTNCYLIVSGNDQRIYYGSTPDYQYAWMPVMTRSVPAIGSAYGDQTQLYVKHLNVEQAGIITPLIQAWYYMREVGQSIEASATLDTPYITLFFELIEHVAAGVALIFVGLIGITLILSFAKTLQ